MKVNIGIELDDEQRALFANALCKKGLASRKDVRAFVDEAIERLLTTQEINNDQTGIDNGREAEAVEADGHRRDPIAVRPSAEAAEPGAGFVPSRGDEPYMYKGNDEGVTAACRTILDQAELIEQFAWETLERNRV